MWGSQKYTSCLKKIIHFTIILNLQIPQREIESNTFIHASTHWWSFYFTFFQWVNINQLLWFYFKVHDACIELAEMLAKTDPKGAVDVYCKFHISDPPTFDDGYILGEIVRLLMKAEDYDDKRLVTNMILYGKVYGLGKHIRHPLQWILKQLI